jgi:hypothetical protein
MEVSLFIFIHVAGGDRPRSIMAQVAEDYEQIPARLGLTPGFINASTASPENRRRRENFLNLFRHYRVTVDVLDPVQSPFQVIDAHTRARQLAGLSHGAQAWREPKAKWPRSLAAILKTDD